MKNSIFIIIIVINQFFVFPQNDSIKSGTNFKDLESFEGVPGLIGGLDLLRSRIKYPEDAIHNKIEGKVLVKVTIDKLGNPIQIKLENGIGYGCDEEVIQAIKSSQFIPPIQNGKPIESFCFIPIVFNLPDE